MTDRASAARDIELATFTKPDEEFHLVINDTLLVAASAGERACHRLTRGRFKYKSDLLIFIHRIAQRAGFEVLPAHRVRLLLAQRARLQGSKSGR